MRYQEFQSVRITSPMQGEDVFDHSVIHQLPAGQRGTIVEVHGDGVAFEVEFILGERGSDGYIDDPDYTLLTLNPSQIAPA